MNRILIGAFVCLGTVSLVRAEQVPLEGREDARVRVAKFVDGEVYRLTGRIGYQIELELEPGEVFLGHGGGDLDGIAVAAHDAHVMLKPRAAGVDTNLVVFTDRRTYRFHYSVEDQSTLIDPQGVIYAVRFEYPPREMARREEVLAAQLDARGASSNVNWDYWYCGSRALKPDAVFDDGVRTYFRFGERSELPALYVLNDDQSESLLNFNVRGDELVVHRTARRFVVRRGRLVGCVVNKSYAGSGERLESGTVAPAVVREAVEFEP